MVDDWAGVRPDALRPFPKGVGGAAAGRVGGVRGRESLGLVRVPHGPGQRCCPRVSAHFSARAVVVDAGVPAPDAAPLVKPGRLQPEPAMKSRCRSTTT